MGEKIPQKETQVHLISFGFKHGLPGHVNFLFDVRFLPNPYYVDGLRDQTGLDRDAASYALANHKGQEFIALLKQILNFLIPQYQQDGKEALTIAIGCTGGKHRSVAVVEEIKRSLNMQGKTMQVTHRDMGRE